MIVMKRITAIVILAFAAIFADAQTIMDNTKWWDGNVLYTAHVYADGTVWFDALENEEKQYEFTLKRMPNMEGTYTLEHTYLYDEAPFRAQFGWIVKYTRQDGMYFLSVRNREDEIVWVLTLTVDNLKNCQGSTHFALTEIEAKDIVTDYMMSAAFLSIFTKDELKTLQGFINDLPKQTVISRVNADLIRNELKVVDSEREAFFQSLTVFDDLEVEEEEVELHAIVSVKESLPQAIAFLSEWEYPSPSIYGKWEEHELTFIVRPYREDCTIALHKVAITDDFETVIDYSSEVFTGKPGIPLCFSYLPPEIIPTIGVVCYGPDGQAMSTWIPQISGEDGSVIVSGHFALD